MVIAVYKPYGVLSQFTPEPGSRWRTLTELGLPPGVYPIGRLDADSEGLLVLTDEAALVKRLLEPSEAHPREYWVQVEGIPDEGALERLGRGGIEIQGHRARACAVRRLATAPELPARTPPIRERRSVPTAWLALELTEGKNRQVRRMTAAVGHPTLRLVRVRIGGLALGAAGLAPGRWRRLDEAERVALLGKG